MFQLHPFYYTFLSNLSSINEATCAELPEENSPRIFCKSGHSSQWRGGRGSTSWRGIILRNLALSPFWATELGGVFLCHWRIFICISYLDWIFLGTQPTSLVHTVQCLLVYNEILTKHVVKLAKAQVTCHHLSLTCFFPGFSTVHLVLF